MASIGMDAPKPKLRKLPPSTVPRTREELDAKEISIEQDERQRKPLAVCLGYVMIVGSTFYKLPQIVQIHHARSARGVSMSAALMDAIGNVFQTAYSVGHRHPLSTYGENASQFVATFMILLQIFWYEHGFSAGALARHSVAFLSASIGACCAPGYMSRVAATAVLDAMKVTTVVLSLTSTLPQIFQSWRARSVGQLSLTTNGIGFAGTLIRMYTTLAQLGDDRKMVVAQMLSVLTKCVIFGQILAYGRKR